MGISSLFERRDPVPNAIFAVLSINAVDDHMKPVADGAQL